ncbi:MAG: Gfo/Idh/MocA family protein, partial [Fimbriimonadales bacterium]
AKGVADKFGFQFAASDPSEILDNPDINAVLIATRHDTHAPYAIRAMQAGKPAFLEKPLAITLEQLRAVERAWQETNGRVLVGYNRRFSPNRRTLQKPHRAAQHALSRERRTAGAGQLDARYA